ncbi:MAG: UDP-4-amino-4,6-dideoxy-N-acetyl-beta-L-altrosamine transaminase [Gammaproteobacteria bacterium]|nr:UDP-4-amino-4,6-dideoxy-N-acetyl-beta-L-altrosamine transaminase [Gammaproteobacteria bacterium]
MAGQLRGRNRRLKRIPYSRQCIDQDDIDAVVEVLKSDFLTQGSKVPEFEAAVTQYVGAKYGIAVSSGTAALHVACLALEIGPGDRVWTSPISFVASANAALYCGAEVDFVDIDPDTFNMSVSCLAAKLYEAARVGTLPKALIVVHMAGASADMQQIAALAASYDIAIIEDAAHALGGHYQGRPVGCCQYSVITCFSFHPVKSITSGEGGMAMTNCPQLAERMQLFRSHGITRDRQKMNRDDGPWYYEQQVLGFNYRMSDIHAALGISQLRKLDGFISKRIALASQYRDALVDLPLCLPVFSADSAWHLYVIRVKSATRRELLYQHLKRQGIDVNVHYIPVAVQPFYAIGADVPNAENHYSAALSLPLFAELSDDAMERIIGCLTRFDW